MRQATTRRQQGRPRLAGSACRAGGWTRGSTTASIVRYCRNCVYWTQMLDSSGGRMAATPHSVLIAGASIAGPALALWLARNGFQVAVVEKAPALRPGGQAVD